MAIGDVLGGVVRERDASFKRDIAGRTAAVNEGNLALGRERFELAGKKFGAEQESAATTALISSATQLAESIKTIRENGKEVPPSLIKGAEQFHAAAQEQPNVALQIESIFAEAMGALTPEQAAVQEGQSQVTTAEAIIGEPLTDKQRIFQAGFTDLKKDRVIEIQDAFDAELDPRRKTQLGLLINKIVNPSTGITINTADTAGGTALKEARQDYLRDIASNGIAAQDTLNNADLLDQALDSVEGTALDAGAFAGLREGLASVAILGGFGDEFAEDLASLTTIDAISQKMTIIETQQLKGAINQREFNAAGKINTAIDLPNLANRFAVKRMRATAKMNSWMLTRAEQIEDANPTWGDNKIAKQMRKEFNNIPYFSKTLKDQNGLPLFFTEFRDSYMEQNPADGTADVLTAWRSIQ